MTFDDQIRVTVVTRPSIGDFVMIYDTNRVENDSYEAPPSRGDRIISCMENLRDEVQDLLNNEALHREEIQKLETELSAFKRAYSNVESERQQLQTFKEEAQKEISMLKSQMKGSRIVTLLDGDGAIFTNELIVQGSAGGHTAAKMLSNSILQFLKLNYGGHQYQLWVYIFVNKRGLMDASGRAGNYMVKSRFEDFWMGFNQAAERFIMVDVGSGKEAADAKIKAHLEADICLSQTCKVIFGGCHDNGYATTLRSQITAGFKHKLILLPTYTEIAAGIAELELPSFTIPELFQVQKIGTQLGGLSTSGGSPTLSPRKGTFQNTALVNGPSVLSQDDENSDNGSGLMVEPEPFAHQSPSTITYASTVLTGQKRASVDSSNSNHTSASGGTRHINPNLPLTKQIPPPCTLHYLASCKLGASCKFGHDYLLQSEHYEELRDNAKNVPCTATNKGEPCLWGEKCCYGHHCPQLGKCLWFKLNRCRFVAADMHKEPKNEFF